MIKKECQKMLPGTLSVECFLHIYVLSILEASQCNLNNARWEKNWSREVAKGIRNLFLLTGIALVTDHSQTTSLYEIIQIRRILP